MELKIEYVPIEDIKPYAGNAKTHPAEQIEQIKRSIEQFGFNDPIAVWKGEVCEGHGRLIAATEMGIDAVPIIRLDNLTDEQRRAYGLVHNKLTMNSGFNFDLLQMELENISFDMSEFDFDIQEDEDLSDYFTAEPAPSAPKANVSDVPVESTEAPYQGNSYENTPTIDYGVETKKQVRCPHCGEWFEV